MSLELIIDNKTSSDYIEITPIGEIDIYTSTEFKNKVIQIINTSEKKIIINGEKLEYMDSTGLGVLMNFLKITKEKNTNITIKNLKKNIYKLFDITGLNNVFNIE